METKLIAAEIATGAGLTAIITSSKRPEDIINIIDYYNNTPQTSPTSSHVNLPMSDHSTSDSSGLSRPLHTMFVPSPTPLRDVKSWTSHTLYPAGSVIIDKGAHHVLFRRESGGRLLPAGVVGVIGKFASGQAVRIVVRRELDSPPSNDKPTSDLGRPAPSISSSAPLPQMLSRHDIGRSKSQDERTLAGCGESEGDMIEIGRGLANYNSEQIDQLKGLNRCSLFPWVIAKLCH
jgi:glutamate 5-kinase